MRICVFCGSSMGSDPAFRLGAETLGTAIGRGGHELVYGGASVGLMGVVADAALNAGAKVAGVLPKALADLELAKPDLSELHVVGSMHERKMMMADLSDAFIAMPGGIGTLEEMFEVWTWTQLGLHSKPVGLLNVKQFYDPLVAFLAGVVDSGFIKQAHFDMLVVNTEPLDLLSRLLSAKVSYEPKWVDSGRE